MGPEIRMWAVPWDKNTDDAQISLCGLLVMAVPGLCALLSFEVLYVIVSYCIFKEANALAYDMKAMTSPKPTDDDAAKQLSFYRQIHSGFADIMDEADDILNKFIGLALIEFIFCLCLTLYNFSQPDISPFDYYYLSIVAFLEFQLVVVVFSGSIHLYSVVGIKNDKNEFPWEPFLVLLTLRGEARSRGPFHE